MSNFTLQVRINQEQEHFLINPFGLTYSEITASSLVKVDMQGEVIDSGTTTLGINKAGFTLHSAIHQTRPDIKCIIHLHTPAAVAVSWRIEVNFWGFHWEIECRRSGLNLVIREAPLKDLRMVRGIFFPNENQKNCIYAPLWKRRAYCVVLFWLSNYPSKHFSLLL